MSDEQTLIKLAEAVYALFSRTADSGPDGIRRAQRLRQNESC